MFEYDDHMNDKIYEQMQQDKQEKHYYVISWT